LPMRSRRSTTRSGTPAGLVDGVLTYELPVQQTELLL
jgi:hypothetical protein